MTHRTEETPEIPVHLKAMLDALESNARMGTMAEVAKKVQEMGANNFPTEFVAWVTMEALTSLKQCFEDERIMYMVAPDKASDAA